MSPRAPHHLPLDDQFDTVFANQLAHYETYNKHHYRPNTYFHKWWGRRCGSTFRLILKGLTAVPDAKTYYQPGGLEGLVILDPMMGGGTTIHEALRMGANVIGVDVDAIPVLQARASLAPTDLAHLESGFLEFFDEVSAAIEPYFQTACPHCGEVLPLRHALYGLLRRCQCREVLVVDSLVIRREADGTVLRFCPRCSAVYRNGDHICPNEDGLPLLIERQVKRCDLCIEPFHDEEEKPYYARYRLLALAGRCPTHGLFYKSPDERDSAVWQQAESSRPEFMPNRAAFAVIAGGKSGQLLKRNIRNYLDLFSSRQLIFLQAALNHLPENDATLRLNLALLVSTSLEFNSMLAGYKGSNTRRAGAVRHTFSHHAYSFPYTALENNPIYPHRSSGTLLKLFYGRLLRGREWAQQPHERVFDYETTQFVDIIGEKDFGTEVAAAVDLNVGTRRYLLRQTSAAALPIPDNMVDAVITDPPYYDSIQYDDLAAYFRVWLEQMVPEAGQWHHEGPAGVVDTSGDREGRVYAESMRAIWCEVRRVLKPRSGRLVFTFHHWQPEAWASLTYALKSAGFRLINRYVVHAEHPISVHIANIHALTHDVILVLAADGQVERATNWHAVEVIPSNESRSFCEACGSLLGYLLDCESLSFEECLEVWRDAVSAS